MVLTSLAPVISSVAAASTPCLVVPSDNMTVLEDAVWAVESNRCTGGCPKGDGGSARGPLQIWRIAWTDVKRDGEKYEDCESLEYSVEVFNRYMNRYAIEKRIGRKVTNEDRARIWNGGPNGYKKDSTIKYWNRVKSVISNSRK